MSGKRAKAIRKQVQAIFTARKLDMRHFRRSYRKAKKEYALKGMRIYD